MVRQLLADLDAEREDLRTLLVPLSPREWVQPSAAPGWSICDQAAHLGFFDGVAALAIEDYAAFAAVRSAALSDVAGFDVVHLSRMPLAAPELLAAWGSTGAHFRRAALAADPKARVPWFGPDMSLLSMITARLMETWAHGQDVADALGVVRAPTARLHHIVGIAVRARGYGYVVRGLDPPADPVRIELNAPDGTSWAFGSERAGELITGPAEDFCLVLTRRRHVEDTALVARGKAANEWLELGQAYAGPPGSGPVRRTAITSKSTYERLETH